jgi:hypothetical protein
VHEAVPFTVLHAMPQPPQLLVSIVVSISQPSNAWPLQLANPALQLITSQVPVAQSAVEFGSAHAVLQPPQSVFVLSAVSQPFCAFESQSAKPALHEMPQMPPEQAGVPLCIEHWFPQAPQLAMSLLVAISQPFATLPSQSA